MTPSAARGIFDAIYAKPKEFCWRIRRIEMLRRPKYIALRRNENKEKVNLRSVAAWMEGKKEPEPIYADGDRALLGSDEKGRTQRQTMALRDVRYRLHGEIRPWPDFEDRQAALSAQFKRRVASGKCFHQPYFGCREFPAYFAPVEEGSGEPIDVDIDVGFMLYDVFDLSKPGNAYSRPAISLFQAEVRQGVLEVPAYESMAVLKATGEAV
jgi:CRISPR-associated protein Cas5d